MPKKRRKLIKDFEKKIYSSRKSVELVLAKIYDIDDEEIQKEYINAFSQVVNSYDELRNNYELIGFNNIKSKYPVLNKELTLVAALFLAPRGTAHAFSFVF